MSVLVTKIQRGLNPASDLAKAYKSLFVSPAHACERDLVAILQEGSLLVTDLERLLSAFCSLKQTPIFSRRCTAYRS